jgi:hypothetical protein
MIVACVGVEQIRRSHCRADRGWADFASLRILLGIANGDTELFACLARVRS